jgi:hypothetical protein
MSMKNAVFCDETLCVLVILRNELRLLVTANTVLISQFLSP